MGNEGKSTENRPQMICEMAARIAELEALVRYYEERLRLMNHRQFGASSEKGVSPDQLGMFDEAENTAGPEQPEPMLEQIIYTRRKRKGSSFSGDVLTAQGVVLDLKRHAVTVNDTPLELTKREFDLLHYLLKNKDIVVTRDMLLENVWDYDFDGGTNAVDVYIRFLRTKIDEAFNIKLIHTVRGVGYVIKDE